ncbi:MAG TPA: OmpH family outer membrane protein [Pyrinomonadaceae bacterium]|nr:OmpH family outer membrane protein [Pyrinomonadaceae bacterium]
MKRIFVLIATIFILTAAHTYAQTTQPPAAQTPAVPTKVAIIDTEAFADSRTGVKRLVNAYAQIDTELKPLRDQLTTMNNRYTALAQKASAGTITQAEADEADNLKRDIQRKQEDGQKQLEALSRQRTGPIFNELSNALQAYAKQRGFDMIVDIAKLQGSILLINQSVDITDAFIADFNAKNPAGATAPVKP